MLFFSNVPAILSRIFAYPYVNTTLGYIMSPINIVIETHWTAPTTTAPLPFLHDPTPAPEGPYPFVSLSPNRPFYRSIPSTSSPFTLLHAFLSCCVVFVIYVAHTLYRQSNRLAQLEKTRIADQVNFDSVEKKFRMRDKAHWREARIVQQKLSIGASFFEAAERRAEEAKEKLKAVLERNDELKKEKVRDEDMRVANEKRMQKQLDEITKRVYENERASQKDREKLKLLHEKLAVKLRDEMTEKVEAANKRAEKAEKELSRLLEESNAAVSKEREGHLASYRAAVKTEEDKESRLRGEIEEGEKRNLRLAKEMTERNEKRYRDDMEKIRVDHLMDWEQMRKENMNREAQYAKELSQLRSDENERMEEKREEKAARLVDKEEQRAVLSKMRFDIGRATNSIHGFKVKSMVRLMEHLRVKREMQSQLMSLFKDVSKCQRALELIRTAGREGLDGSEHEIAVMPTSCRQPSPEPPSQGLPTPAPSQSPPPREATATLPLDQVIPVIDSQPADGDAAPPSDAHVKQEDVSFELHNAVYGLLETETSMRIGPSNNNVDVDNALPQVFPDQSISLSKLPDVDNLLSVSQPRWSNTSLFESLSLDNVLDRGQALPIVTTNESFLPSVAVLASGDDLREISPHQCSQSDSPEDGFTGRQPLGESIELAHAGLPQGDDLREISPPQWSQGSVSETNSNDASSVVERRVSNVSLLLSTNKTGIQFKCHSPTPSPSKSAMSTLGDFDGSTSFHPLCTSSPSAPRTLKITTGADDDSFAPEDSGLLPSSSSWLGCHPPTSELKGTWSRSPAEQENDYIVHQSPSYSSLSVYLPALSSTSASFAAADSTSPSSAKGTVANKRELPAWQNEALKPKRRMSYGNKSRPSVVGKQDARCHSLPAIVSDLFNPL